MRNLKMNVLLCALFALLAGSAFGQSGVSGGKKAPVPSTFLLTVSVNPSSADIAVDGAPIKGNAVVVGAGSHVVQATASGYQAKAVTVQVSGAMTVSLSLDPITVALTISVNVKGATVMVDGMQVMANPLMVAPGAHQVQASAPGFLPWAQSVSVSGPQTLAIVLQPSLFNLTISVPGVKGASVFVDGAQMTVNPIALAPGAHTVQVSAAGYLSWTQTVNLTGNMSLSATLQPQLFNLTVSIPGVKGASVFVDGAQMTMNPLALAPGAHSVRASAAGYADWNQTITVSGDMNLTVSMQRAMATLIVRPMDAMINKGARGNHFGLMELWIDGVQVPLNKDRIDVAAGTHAVRFVTGGLQAEATLSFDGGIQYVLEPSLALKATPLSAVPSGPAGPGKGRGPDKDKDLFSGN